ncbi:MAG: O-antigen biosynthesis protein [Solirubrobacteraceae bacterium]|jgi:glycosyltransferase involved in cell wall biosynthesis|nr:O-antigen biosynthesis protein [Solirubrobacteraceae bacterium]
MTSKRSRHIREILRQGPTEAGYAFFRARRRRRNLADDDLELSASERLALDPAVDLDMADLEAHAAVVRRRAAVPDGASLQWFFPGFHLVTGGGVHTALRLADLVAREHGIENRFHLYDRDAPGEVPAKAAAAFPALANARFTAGDALPGRADAAIATTWESGFHLVGFNDTRAKLMLVQDWEPDFHPAGSARAILELLAALGIPGLVNSPGLADSWRAAGNPATAFTPAVDTGRFRPGPRPDEPVRIFFYGRPRTARNAFGLGLAALRHVKARFGSGVEIVSAGEDWSPGQYGADDLIENRGMLEDLDTVAELYRSCHVGLVFMLTRHPSYQPLEFMASGMATVSNRNPHTEWLLRHEETALLADPLPALVAEQVGRLVRDAPLRARIADAGRALATARTWDDELDRAWRAATAARR